MFDGNKTHTSKGRVFQSVGVSFMKFGNAAPIKKEILVKQSDMYKMTRIGKVHKISTLSGGVVQMSGSCAYCMDWWDANVATIA